MSSTPDHPDHQASLHADEANLLSGLARLLDAARRHGVEMDADEAAAWLTAMQAPGAHHLAYDDESGVFGARAALLDFDPTDLDELKAIGNIVRLPDGPGVRTALALSGSAAQSRIQRYPGDRDFMQRVHITAPTREQAHGILARLIREKALRYASGTNHRFARLKFGVAPENLSVRGKLVRAHRPLEWTLDDVREGVLIAENDAGDAVRVTWEDAARTPGWCKLDWLVTDRARREVLWASNVLDPTWEAPDGTVTSLDGQFEPMYQEVYLDAESAALVEHLAQHLDEHALTEYIHCMEAEVEKYLGSPPNYGKAARRMYNLFRYTGRYEAAAYLRELFDEPTTALYKVWTAVGLLSEHASDLDEREARAAIDELILTAVRAMDGQAETNIVRDLLRLRDALSVTSPDAHAEIVRAARDAALSAINTYFYTKLNVVPEIQAFLRTDATREETRLP